jgi:hypothetical protein
MDVPIYYFSIFNHEKPLPFHHIIKVQRETGRYCKKTKELKNHVKRFSKKAAKTLE